ncbi:NADH dehydrogenase [ubiquinone] flavoprotein 3, mitochondrial [Protobothrops mucrosquamatus]|uniref:NADH dehydrogenase [ubiquinone] flavoprotein 3, mitochondrial n=1 Tax=Protobothrops mucrosquamatus TaxID=103944 RepID=UPI0007756FA7|nr:NADH dehydrogenase [ubiquinone] flavoprotein 3, mitochondrial [Protobothrops mucrosquamatus]
MIGIQYFHRDGGCGRKNGVGTFSLRPKEDTEQVLGDAKMAASAMACCGRLPAFKALSQQAWGLRSMPSVYVCTKPGDSKKGFPKDKGKIITNCKPDAAVKLTDEDLRKFLAMKTLVMFPQKAQFPFERKPVFSSTEGLGKRLTDEESSSSSSSESGSSSDSEDDEFKEKPHRQKKLYGTTDNKQLKSDMIKTASKQRPKEVPVHLKSKKLGIVNAESQKPTEVSSESLEVPLSKTDPQRTRLVPPQNISQNLEQDENITQKMQKTEMQDRVFEEPGPEVSRERMPVIKTTLKEEIIPEVEAQIEEQSTPQAAKPSPETAQETYDTSTYKNLQHHEYQPFTFVDFDVLLSKFRLPQPSSGRLSPRH